MKLISFVIPCYRSELTIESVYKEIVQTVQSRENYDYEILAVNDASPDNVLEKLVAIAKSDKKFKVVDCAKNMGKHGALMAGFGLVTGDYVVCVDDDCQCPVNELWKLIEALEQGYDVSMAEYGKKNQSGLKNLGSWANDYMMTHMLGKPKEFQFANFAAMKRFVVDEMVNYKNPYSYVNGLILRTTSSFVNIPMKERARESGKSGYTFRKSLQLWIDGFTAFSVKPLRMAMRIGIVSFLVGIVLIIWAILNGIVSQNAINMYTIMIAVMLLVAGILMCMMGLIGEYVGRVYMCINNSPQYIIRETWNIENH